MTARPTYSKKEIIAKAVAELRGTLEYWLKDDVRYGSVYLQDLEGYQSMHYRGEIEIFKVDEDEVGDVEPEYN